jgi:hypothetical protein
MKTLNEQYQLIKEGKGHKGVFLNEAKRQFPNYIRNAATFEETTTILKQKGVINENLVGLSPINTIETSKKESFELAFEKFIEEAKDPQIKAKEVKGKTVKSQEEDEKAELKKPSKQVEEDLAKGYDYSDKKNLDNVIYGQLMKGYYAEMKDPKNEDKTMEQIRDIVLKNLEKDPTHYVKDGQFGVKGLGYVTEHPGLGTPKEPTGKYKASGYGDLKESIQPINEEEQTLRKIVRAIINEEIEEAYQLKNINIKYPKKDREERDPSDKYLTFDKDFEKIERRKENLIVKDDNTIFITKVLHANLGPKAGNSDLRKYLMDRTNLEPAVLGGRPVWKIKGAKLNSKGSISVFVPVEKKFEESITEGIEKDLAAINKEAEHEALQNKLDKVQALIDKKQTQLNRLDEDEDMKDLTDKKKVKEIEKDIKALEKAKSKIEKMMSKGKGKKKEVIDEMEDENPSPELLKALTQAEEMYERGLDINDILSKFDPLMHNDIERHLKMGYEGTDND